MMSEKMKEQLDGYTWYNGAEQMPEPQPVVVTQKVFENETGQKLFLQVSGPQQQVREYLESMSFTFRAEPLEDITALEAELSQQEDGRDSAMTDEPDSAAVNIHFDFLELEPPFQWEVWFDPLNVSIAGAAVPHKYKTTKSTQVTATIGADMGRLTMSIGQQSVTVGGGNPSQSLTATSTNSIQFRINVDGLNARNQYDLYVSGATLA